MDSKELLEMSNKRLRRAEKAYANNYNRTGITEDERNYLSKNLRYEQLVNEMIETNHTLKLEG